MFFQGIVVTLVFLFQHTGPCTCIGVCDWWGGCRSSHRGSTWWCLLCQNSYCVSLKCNMFNLSRQNYTLLHWSHKIVDQLVIVKLYTCFPLWWQILCSVTFDPPGRVVYTWSPCTMRCWDSYWRRSHRMRWKRRDCELEKKSGSLKKPGWSHAFKPKRGKIMIQCVVLCLAEGDRSMKPSWWTSATLYVQHLSMTFWMRA